MPFYWLVLGILAVWRVTHLLHAEEGPADVLVKLREFLGHGVAGRTIECFYCLSLWVAIPLALVIGQSWREGLLLWLAMSAGAILLERATEHKAVRPLYVEDPSAPPVNEDVQLRQ